MYLPPYHGHYQYQSSTQRYPGQQPSTVPLAQYSPSGQSQIKSSSSQYSGYGSSVPSNLPPYA